LGLKSFLKSSARLLRLAKKPGGSELWLSVKICFLGVFAVGAVAFLIKFIASVVQQT
jgi:protein translocase SEC61 complex gamma subunit